MNNTELLAHLKMEGDSMAGLFQKREAYQAEIERRAWSFLKSIGYKWYTQESITVDLIVRNETDLITITAEMEYSYQPVRVDRLEVPLTFFETATR